MSVRPSAWNVAGMAILLGMLASLAGEYQHNTIYVWLGGLLCGVGITVMLVEAIRSGVDNGER